MTVKKKRKKIDLGNFLDANQQLQFSIDNYLSSDEIKINLSKELESFHFRLSNHTTEETHDSDNPLYASMKKISEIDGYTTKQNLRDQHENIDAYSSAGLRFTGFTSGSSGRPLKLVYSPKFNFSMLYYSTLKVCLRGGLRKLPENDIFSVFISDNMKLNNEVFVDPNELTGLTVRINNSMQSNEDFSLVLSDLNRYRPFVITSKPHLLYLLANYLLLNGLNLNFSPRYIVCSGSSLTSEVRMLIENVFKTKVLNAYLVSEIGYVASECAHGVMHINPEIKVEEYFDESLGQHLIIASTVQNEFMPLYRYSPGDIGIVEHDQKCICGSKSSIIKSLEGRVVPIFDLGENVKVAPSIFMNIFTDCAFLSEYQMTQTADRCFSIIAQFRTQEDINTEHLRRYLTKHFPVKVNLDIRAGELSIAAGKFVRFRINK